MNPWTYFLTDGGGTRGRTEEPKENEYSSTLYTFTSLLRCASDYVFAAVPTAKGF